MKGYLFTFTSKFLTFATILNKRLNTLKNCLSVFYIFEKVLRHWLCWLC